MLLHDSRFGSPLPYTHKKTYFDEQRGQAEGLMPSGIAMPSAAKRYPDIGFAKTRPGQLRALISKEVLIATIALLCLHAALLLASLPHSRVTIADRKNPLNAHGGRQSNQKKLFASIFQKGAVQE